MAKASKKKVSRRAPAAVKPRSLQSFDVELLRLIEQRAAAVHSHAREHSPAETIALSLASAQQTLAAASDVDETQRAAYHDLLKHIASVCHLGLHMERVAYLGPEYSFSHLAAIKYFGSRHAMVPVPTISAVFDAIVRHDARLGLVPIENSTDGRVVDTLGMFVRNPVQICGEVLLPIHHYLLGKCARDEVTEVYSKPQALSQCRRWLAAQMPAARLVEMSSTAAAAQLAAEKPGAAAIASLEAGRLRGLSVIDARIEDNPNNVTRFAVLGAGEGRRTGDDKTSLLFQVPHEPGALADAMVIFKKNELNLTWIESFPLPGADGQYLFFVELLGHRSDRNVASALEQLGRRALRLDWLGSYPRGYVS